MHELSLARAIVDTALRHAEGRRVEVVALRIGALRQVVEDPLRFGFELVARGTPCEGAQLDVAFVPAELACAACGRRWRAEGFPRFRCEACGGTAEVLAGEEFEIEWIEVEERACTA